MLYREIIAVCSQIHTKHTNTVCGQNVELLNVKLAVHIVTTWLWRVSRHRLTFSQATVNCPCPVPDTCLCTCVYLFFTPGTRTHSYTHSYLLQHACLSYKVPSFVCIASDNALAKQIAPHPTFTVFILVKRYKNKKNDDDDDASNNTVFISAMRCQLLYVFYTFRSVHPEFFCRLAIFTAVSWVNILTTVFVRDCICVPHIVMSVSSDCWRKHQEPYAYNCCSEIKQYMPIHCVKPDGKQTR